MFRNVADPLSGDFRVLHTDSILSATFKHLVNNEQLRKSKTSFRLRAKSNDEPKDIALSNLETKERETNGLSNHKLSRDYILDVFVS